MVKDEDVLHFVEQMKNAHKSESELIKTLADSLDAALDSEDIHAEVQRIRNKLYSLSKRIDKLWEGM